MTIENRTGFGLAWRAREFLNKRFVEEHTRRQLMRQQQEISALRSLLAKKEAGGDHSIDPDRVVWVFGSGRTGSSWLTFMMGALHDHTRWNEPLVGYLFGHLYYERAWPRQGKKHFILAKDYEGVWLNSIRSLVLDGGAARFPERIGGGYLVIKEPHGSLGAPLLMQALPESRMIFLVRDPRDVAASALKVSFVPKSGRDQSHRVKKATERPEAFASTRAWAYGQDIQHSKLAYDAHKGRKALVRYEDLRAGTLETMKRIYLELEIPVDVEELARVVKARAFENIPEEEKGEGTIRRKATPGGWKEDLKPRQVRLVEEETAWILDEFYDGG